MLILITSGTVREDNFHLLGLQLPPSFDLSLHPLQASAREILSKHDLRGQFSGQVETITPGQTTPSPHFRPLRPISLLQASTRSQDLNEKVFPEGMQSKIPPIRTPKDTEQFSTPRCAMEVSYCHEDHSWAITCQQGKYEEKRRKKVWERRREALNI